MRILSTPLDAQRNSNAAVTLVTLWMVWGFMVTAVGARHVTATPKIIQTKDGDIFDCVDIYQQPSLKHPLFKDHKIQMWPSWFDPKALSEEEWQKIRSSQFSLEDEECPQGTVAILRLSENVTSDASSISAAPLVTDADIPQDLTTIDRYWAYRRTNLGVYYGASAEMNVYGIQVEENQTSMSMIWVVKTDVATTEEQSIIAAGWTASPILFNDSKTRLVTHWSVDGQRTNCYNYNCPGFIQLHSYVTLGMVLSPLSTVGGTQYGIRLFIRRDPANGHWWLSFRDQSNFVGYWHSELFKGGGGFNHATIAEWGGFVLCSSSGMACPPMGNGNNPGKVEDDACFMTQVEVIDSNETWTDLDPKNQTAYTTWARCYDVGPLRFTTAEYGYSFRYGGSRPCLIWA